MTPLKVYAPLWLFIASLLGEHCRWLYTRSQADDSEARTRAFRGVVEAAPTRRLTAPKAGERLPGPEANAHTHITNIRCSTCVLCCRDGAVRLSAQL